MAIIAIGALAVALFAALGPFAIWFGFAPMPGRLLVAILGLTVCYLVAAEGLKQFAMTD